MNNDIYKRALAMIQRSSVVDFSSPLQWGQWCRDVARAAEHDDVEGLNALEGEIA